MSATPSFTSFIDGPGTDLKPSYLDLIITSNSILNPTNTVGGTEYDAWCMDQKVQLKVGANYTTYLYSSYEVGTLTTSVPTLAASKYLGNLDNINWLLNWYNGSNAAYGDVQGAIWKMLGSATPMVNYVGPQSAANIDALIAEAMKHDGYVPDIGDTIAAVMDPMSGTTHSQPLLVTMKAASIGDRVWHDTNANGVQDAGEAGIANVVVKLVRDQNQDGDFADANEVIATTTTDSNGNYSFKGLTPGLNYQVVFSQPTGYDSVSPRQSDGAAGSGVNSDAMISNVVVLKDGENNATIDAGFYNKASLGDRLWLDTNGNGQQDAGETGVAGATVTLTGGGADGLLSTTADNTTVTVKTDANGNYSFTNLTPGTEYQVQFGAPAGTAFTRQDAGPDASDSDVNAKGLSQIVKLASGENNTTIDAGVVAPASLGDRVWNDANANGQQDAGETGVAGATVTLIGGGADGLLSTTADNTAVTIKTDANGNYSFTNLTPGTEYQVQFGAPAGTVFTAQDKGSDATDSDANASGLSQVVKLASGENNTTVDAGVYAPASLGDRVWLDANGNGQQDAGEQGVAGATVTLTGGGADGLLSTTADNTTITTTTDANGNYSFTHLTPGTEYQVQFSAPAGAVFTAHDKGSDATDSDANANGLSQIVKLAAGENNTTVDAGVVVPASLGDRVWLDANGNGQQDAGERGVADATVTLTGGGADGLLSTTADNTTVTTTTDANGNYKFTDLTPGTEYQVQFSAPAGAVFTAQDKGSDATDSDADAHGVSQVVTLASGENNTTIDAGVYVPASLGDRVWVDANGNGQQDAGEHGVADLNVTLVGGGADGLLSTTADNTSVTTKTDANGNYSFTNLTPGTEYQVQFSAPAGAVFTAQDKGSDVTDSDADAHGVSQVVTLTTGENNTTIDAGIYVPASLGDRVWFDANGNGQQDAGEHGVADLNVTLVGGGADGLLSTTADNTSVTTKTDANGNYSFTNLTPGTEYQVQFSAPAGAIFTTQDKGSDVTDSDADAHGLSQVVTLASGENNTTIDAGVYVPASLGDRVWLDANGNGQQDAGEHGVADLNVTLIGGGADGLLSTTGDNTSVTTKTDANGNYSFTNLTPGTEYQVQFSAPAGAIFTTQDKGSDVTDSDADAHGLSQVVTLASGENNTTIDAGIYVPASLGDRVWLDANGNGQQDAGEKGIADLNVTLIGGGADGLLSTTADNTTITTKTDANGNYSFTNLTPGTEYQVQFSAPAGAVFTAQDKGSDVTDSDADAHGLSQVVTLTSGENNTTIDAGIYVPASLGDRVWLDADGNGQQDAGERGVADLNVTLIGGGADGLLSTTGDNTSVTTKTDANGNYSFTNLTPGTEYQVQFSAPIGAVFTAHDKGDDASDSDASASGLSQVVTLASGENNTTIDAGVYVQASLGDRVWLDANGNGQQDAGEKGVADLNVTLTGGGADGLLSTTADNTTFTTKTDANGNYSFINLTPGTEYQVQFSAPAGAVFTAQDKGSDVTDSDANANGLSQIVKLAAGENNTTLDAGIYVPASLGDRVWLDANGNGQQDAGEHGVADLSVTLVGGGADGLLSTTGDNTSVTTKTDANGNYSFANLTPGTEYQVQFSAPAGAVFTAQDKGSDVTDSDANASGLSQVVTLASGENNTTIDAGIYVPASLGDRVWLDANGNGQQDSNEKGIADLSVTLVGGGADGLLSTTADNTSVTTKTDANGNYSFANLTPGTEYQVQFSAPTGAVFTAHDKGDDATDSDASASGLSQVVTLTSGENNTTIDAGVYVPASLGDRVWLDANGNGQQDAGEHGVADLSVTLVGGGADGLLSTTADNTTVTVKTDANGNYSFANLTPGTEYQVQFSAPAGAVFTAHDKGDDVTDSDANANGLSQVVTLASGENNTTIDAGVYAQASLGDRVWLDANGNGQQDAGEKGIADLNVTLIGGGADGLLSTTADNTTVTVKTDASGNYSFTNLTPGTEYQVQFSAPAGAVFTAQDKGSDVTDSDADANGLSQIVKLAAGENNTTVDAGVYVPASLGDRVWVDANGNGQQDAGEQGVAGATVTLSGGGADGLLSTTADNTTFTTKTDANGNYSFTNLTPGTEYQVKFSAPAGTTFTVQDKGADASDSDANASGLSPVVKLASGENNTTIDAGVFAPASLGDRVWVDANGNGIQDTSEANVAGVVVNLIDATGAIVGSRTTGADGQYLFDNLTPGDYRVGVDMASLPAGYVITTQNAAGSTALNDSDADPVTGRTAVTTLVSGESDRSWDIGIKARATGIDIEKYVHGEYVTPAASAPAEGLTPGFWKNHTGAEGAPLSGWPETGLSPNASYEALFGVDVPGSAPSLLDALGTQGGGVDALLRHSAAALLNASDPYINYAYTKAQVISMVQAAFASGNYDATKNLLAKQNELEANLTDLAPTATKVVTQDVDADTADAGPSIPVGGTAVFTYVVKNTGSVELSDVSVVDDRIANVTYVGGDTDKDGKLDVNETWTYTASEAVTSTAIRVNTGTVIARDAVSNVTVKDADVAYYGSNPVGQTLGDRLWHDANGNGQQDVNEAGIAGATVQLKNTAGTVLQTTTTDANGYYLFNVATGSYKVTFQTPTGFVATAKDVGNDATDSDIDATMTTGTINIVTGQQNLTVDAGVYQTASLGNRVWLDANHNGQQDAGETGVAGATVTLIGGGADGLISTAADNTTVTTKTDANGNYSFTNLTPGTEYQVQFSAPAGGVFTLQDKGDDAGDSDANAGGLSQIVKLASGENNTTIDAGIYVPASLGDRVWVDTNGNGQQDAGELGVAGATVTLIGGGADGLISTTADNTTVTTTTDANGNYKFVDLAPGTEYQVKFSAPAGSVFTAQDKGSDASDSDANASGLSQVVKLAPGENNTTIDAGVFVPASLGDRVWLDTNGNGQQDSGETGVAGATVTLIGGGADGLISTAADNTTVTTKTDANGNYSFTNLTPGTEYQVQFSAPAGTAFTKQDAGLDASDSDADVVTGKSQIVKLGSGESNKTIDAGVVNTTGDLSITKTDGLASVQAGQSITYTIVAKNAGTGVATDALVKDMLPSYLTNVTWTSSASAGASGNQASGTGGINDTISLNGGASVTYTVKATVAGLSALEKVSDFGSLTDNVSLGQNVSVNGIRADAAYITSSGGIGNAALWSHNATGDKGLGVLSPNESATAGDANELSNQANKEVIRLTKTDGEQWSSVWVNSLDKSGSGATVGTLYWSDSDTPNLATLTTKFTFKAGDFGLGAQQGDLLSLHPANFDADAKYLFFVAGDGGSGGAGSDYLVWKAGTIPTEIANTATIAAPAGFTDTNAANNSATDVDHLTVPAPAPVVRGSIGDTVWEDLNYNGVRDSGENGIANVTVHLLDSANNVMATTVTNSSGNYLFSNLNAGSYKIEVVEPSNYYVTKQNVGTSDGLDSDIDTAAGRSGTITLAQGQNDMTWDAGLYRKASIGDKVWRDADHDDIQDAGEEGIPNVKVMLYSASGTLLASTVTNSSGNYKFSNLDPGSYYLKFDKTNVQFAGYNMNTWKWASKDIGTNDAIDSDVAGDGVATTNVTRTDVTTLHSGENDMTWDAAITPIAIDLNGDGVHTVSRADSTGTFDLLGNGKAIASGWLSSSDGFLAVDRNGNGTIDDISELFGGNVKGAGFASLAGYDSNGDGVVDLHDDAFAELRIWRDANGNHKADAGELLSLADAGVVSLKVDHVDLPFVDAQGNLHIERSSATLAGGKVADMTDVYFSVDVKDAGSAPTLADLVGDTGMAVEVQVGLVGQTPHTIAA
jgi:uncharacterized repeat protein (TIGR01451 family)